MKRLPEQAEPPVFQICNFIIYATRGSPKRLLKKNRLPPQVEALPRGTLSVFASDEGVRNRRRACLFSRRCTASRATAGCRHPVAGRGARRCSGCDRPSLRAGSCPARRTCDSWARVPGELRGQPAMLHHIRGPRATGGRVVCEQRRTVARSRGVGSRSSSGQACGSAASGSFPCKSPFAPLRGRRGRRQSWTMPGI